MARSIFFDLIRFLLIALFVYAGASKMITYPAFTVQVGLSPLLPSFFPRVAWLVPVVELGVGVCLLMPAFQRIGLYASWVLLLLFTLYVAAILTVAGHVPCSCGGVVAALSWREHLVFNLVFLVLNSVALVWDFRDLRKQVAQ
jgi:uncharacterized membrane protein YphA (DoxX/SURF4 family)